MFNILQIISGKFFSSDNRKRHHGKGITYSNYSWIAPITTCVATIEPVVLSSSNVTPYVISYLNQIESLSDTPLAGEIVRVGDPEIIHQFQLLCLFGLRAYFDIDRDRVAVNCREIPQTSNDNFLPSRFTTRFFEPQIHGKQEEVNEFIKLVDQTIGMPRNCYEIVMTCMENFTNSLQIINYNLDLAYSMMVYSLEALSQSFDGYQPSWEDYDGSIAKRLEAELCKLDSTVADNIKQVLLQSSHLKLQKRFIDFIMEHVKENFFIEEAIEQTSAIRRSEIGRALKNAYNMRSKYVHQLQQIPDQMRYPHAGKGDVFHWGNDVYFTYNGLTRLAHHVIKNFIFAQTIINEEEFDWRSNLPGVLKMPLAPQYWIWQHEHFTPSEVFRWLSGFLEHIQTLIVNQQQSRTNLTELLRKMEGLINSSQVLENQKRAMVCTTLLFLAFSDQMTIMHDKCCEHQKYLEICTIEKMILDTLLAGSLTDDASICETEYNKYLNNKFNKYSIKIPVLIDISIIVELANKFLVENNIPKYHEWMRFAIFEAAGNNELQIRLSKGMQSNSIFDIKQVFKTEADSIEEQHTEGKQD